MVAGIRGPNRYPIQLQRSKRAGPRPNYTAGSENNQSISKIPTNPGGHKTNNGKETCTAYAHGNGKERKR